MDHILLNWLKYKCAKSDGQKAVKYLHEHRSTQHIYMYIKAYQPPKIDVFGNGNTVKSKEQYWIKLLTRKKENLLPFKCPLKNKSPSLAINQ